jgi:hypothetical protein
VDWCTIFPSSGIGNCVDNLIQVGYTVGLCGDDILWQTEMGANIKYSGTIWIEINKQHGDRANEKYFGIYSTSVGGVTTIKNRFN